MAVLHFLQGRQVASQLALSLVLLVEELASEIVRELGKMIQNIRQIKKRFLATHLSNSLGTPGTRIDTLKY